MIRPHYAIKLARTKLHSRRLLLALSVVISSLLFAVLIAGISVFTGAEKSATRFIEQAHDGGYLVEVQPVIPNSVHVFYETPMSIETIRQLEQYERDYYDSVEQRYHELGVEYDDSTEVPVLIPDVFAAETLPEEQRVRVNHQSPVVDYMAEQSLSEYLKTAQNTVSHLRELGNMYGASGYYTSHWLATGIPALRLVSNAGEDFTSDMKSGDFMNHGYFTNAMHNGAYMIRDQALLERYLLPQAEREMPAGIPVVVSVQEAVRLFGSEVGIGDEPTDQSAQLAWFREAQSKLNGHMYQACYRNAADLALIETVQREYTDRVNNQDNDEYRPPAIQYDLPAEPCGAVVIAQDTRTDAEREAEAQFIQQQIQVGLYEEPARQLLSFQIVGLAYSQPYSDRSASATHYFKDLFSSSSSLSHSALIPQQHYDRLPEEYRFPDAIEVAAEDNNQLAVRVLSFPTIDQARSFIDNEACAETINCDRLYAAAPYGSNYLVLDDIGSLFRQLLAYGLPIIIGLAAVIVWFMMARIMSDNRKETAVYRAMGARRGDIMAIYYTYGGVLSVRVLVLSFVIGIATAYGIDYMYGAELNSLAATLFGVDDPAVYFTLFDVSSPLLIWVAGIVVVISIAAITPSIIRNVRRNPIRDMRAE